MLRTTKKGLLSIIVLAVLLPLCGYGQEFGTNRKKLEEQAKFYKLDYQRNFEKASKEAKKWGWTTFKELADGGVVSLQRLDEAGQPLYLTTYNNSFAAATTRADRLYEGGGLGLSLSGSSTFLTNKVGIWDGGSVYAYHQEFADNRIDNRETSGSVSQHATHVAGTMMARGINPAAKGMAFNLPKLISYNFNSDLAEMAIEAPGLLLSNHSYGYISGWNVNTSQNNRWEWYGVWTANATTEREDYKFGFYDEETRRLDEICYLAPDYLPVKSAGNNRNQNGPANGGTYFRLVGNTWTSFVRGEGEISNNNSYDCISLTGNAKNILTVGAIFGLPNGPFTPSQIQNAPFSSWGPTDDGRIKPDIVGMGVSLTSTINTGVSAYGTLSGTSMSSPNVSGSLILLQEAYAQANSGRFMKSASLKGLAIHTADEAGNAGPDYIYGWGLLNMEKAAQVIQNNGGKSRILEETLNQGATKTYTLVSSGNGPLKATICWTDPPGMANTANTVDERTLKLVNDLDIRITGVGGPYLPWVLDPEMPANPATIGDNFRDNVEQIVINNATPGRTYTLTVTHKTGTLIGASQAFSLILTGVGGGTYCSSGPTNSADSKITGLTLSNVNYSANNTTCTTYTDNTNQTIELEAGKTYPINLKLGTCGGNFDKAAKVYLDTNSDGDFTDANEELVTTGVINGNGEFNGSIVIPNSVVIDDFTLLRVVLVEGNNPALISSCGTYAKGETADFKVKFLKPSIDVGISGITDPITGVCANPGQTVTVKLKNFGSSSVSNIPVSVVVKNGNTTVKTLTQTYTKALTAGEEAAFTLSGSFSAVAGVSYQFEATTSLTGDLDSRNNAKTANATISLPPSLSNVTVSNCSEAGTVALNATGSGNIFWYKAANDQLPIAYTIGSGTTNFTGTGINTYFAGINDFSGKLGPATNTVFNAGGYVNGNNPSVLVNTKVPIVLESAQLYIGNAGKITFTASRTDSGIEVSKVTLDVSPPGEVYNLNLLLPEAGDYTISISYEGGASIWRNNGGVSGYPFTIGGIFSITGNTATAAAPATFADFYYYFYDLKVRSAGCAGDGTRVAATAVSINPVITRNGNTLTSNITNGVQWLLNGQPITNASAATYSPTSPGNYSVKISAGSCNFFSNSILYGVDFPLAATNFRVSTTSKSCKTQNDGKISVTAALALNYTATLTLNTTNTTYKFVNTLDISNLNAGNYKLCISVDGNSDYKACFDLVITEPKDLSVSSETDLVTNTVSLALNGGDTYEVTLNGNTFKTASNLLSLPLKNGPNKLRVSTDKECQGIIEKTIYVADEVMIFPNPFDNLLNVTLGSNESGNRLVSIVDSSGQQVYKQTHEAFNGNMQLNLSYLKNGLYFIKIVNGNTEVISKILKR